MRRYIIAIGEHYDEPYKAELLAASLEKMGNVSRTSIMLWHSDRLEEIAQNRFQEIGYKLVSGGAIGNSLKKIHDDLGNNLVILAASHIVLNPITSLIEKKILISNNDWLIDIARDCGWGFEILSAEKNKLVSYTNLDPLGNIEVNGVFLADQKEDIEIANRFISELTELAFYKLYKRGLAKERLSNATSVPKNIFEKIKIWKEQSGSKLQRLIFHIGTPKTGTTALQHFLFENRQTLVDRYKIWYPDPSPGIEKFNHRNIIELFTQSDINVADRFLELFKNAPDDAETLFFSHEDLSFHWCISPQFARIIFKYLADIFNTELWVWFREPFDFCKARYYQGLKSGGPVLIDFSPTADLESNLKGKWLSELLNYQGLLYEAEELVGKSNVRCFLYQKDTVGDCLKALSTPLPYTISREHNVSLGEVGIEILKVINSYSYRVKNKVKAVELIRQIEQMLGEKAPPYRPSEMAKNYIDSISKKEWAVVNESIGRFD